MKICQNCGMQMPDESMFCTSCGTRYEAAASQPQPVTPPQSSTGMNFDFNTNTAIPVDKTYYEYKVLSQKDKWFSGKFDPAMLEQALNAYAEQGWRVVSCATADIPSAFGANRQEFITILEREK